jgi:hypothetical protein
MLVLFDKNYRFAKEMPFFSPKIAEKSCHNIGPRSNQEEQLVEREQHKRVADLIRAKRSDLGSPSYREKAVGAVFWILVALWFFRSPGIDLKNSISAEEFWDKFPPKTTYINLS